MGGAAAQKPFRQDPAPDPVTLIAAGDYENHGDTSTVADPSVVAEIVKRVQLHKT